MKRRKLKMSKRFGLALVQFDCDSCNRNYLFETPRYASLKFGDKVYVEDSDDVATVISVWDNVFLDTSDKDAFDMIVAACGCGATLPLKKLVSKVNISKFTYEED
jgi:hypothetical protein